MKHFLIKPLTAMLMGMILLTGQAMAATITVSVKNLTNGLYFTPFLVTAHNDTTHLFEIGRTASPALQAMAEGGNTSLLTEMVGGIDQDTVETEAGVLLAPGEMVTDIYLDTPRRTRNRYLSIVAMMLPTNDGFVGLDSLRIPRKPGTYRHFLIGYDAGTEANDEQITGGGAPGVPGIPVDPGNNASSGGSGILVGPDFNPTVHIHRGIIGDNVIEAGISDLDSTIHRWLNPVAEVVIKVGR